GGEDIKGALVPGEGSNRQGNIPDKAAFLFGGQSDYHTGTATFETRESNRPVLVLQITGTDDLAQRKAPIRITLNGQLVWEGDNPLPNGESGNACWIIHARCVLRRGQNRLVDAHIAPKQIRRA